MRRKWILPRWNRHPLPYMSAVVLLATLAGGLVGYVQGRAMLVRSAKSRLVQYAGALVQHGDDYADEIEGILKAANASRLPFCSDQEISQLRGFAFRSLAVKDVGRVRDGDLYCSGVFGRLELPMPMPTSDITTEAGWRIYAIVPPQLAADDHATIFELGEALVVLAPNAFVGWGQPPMRYMIAIVNRPKNEVVRTFGDTLNVDPTWIISEGEKRLGGVIYRSSCSTVSPICAVTAMSTFEVWQMEPTLLMGYTAMGGLAGLGLGFAGGKRYLRHGSMEKQLRRAIRREALQVVYQPIIDVGTRRIVGAEALVRWSDEEGNAVGPEIFVTMAEERGFIGEITQLVLRIATLEMGDLLREEPDFVLSINAAAEDLKDHGFFSILREHVDDAGIRPRQVALELTERSTADKSFAPAAILKLRQHGHPVHIDDFGTGYSSLSYLHALDIDAIKIDRSFTSTIGTEAVTASILPQILSMADTLHLDVTVEGVETESQAKYLEAIGGAILVQGWYFSRPLPAYELQLLVRQSLTSTT